MLNPQRQDQLSVGNLGTKKDYFSPNRSTKLPKYNESTTTSLGQLTSVVLDQKGV